MFCVLMPEVTTVASTPQAARSCVTVILCSNLSFKLRDANCIVNGAMQLDMIERADRVPHIEALAALFHRYFSLPSFLRNHDLIFATESL